MIEYFQQAYHLDLYPPLYIFPTIFHIVSFVVLMDIAGELALLNKHRIYISQPHPLGVFIQESLDTRKFLEFSV